MRLLFLALLLLAADARAQFGVGITIPAGRSTHRLGTVPDSLAVYAPKELDVRPRCLGAEDAWVAMLLDHGPCAAEPWSASCRPGAAITLRFTIERDGSVSDLLLAKGGCAGLEERLQCAMTSARAWDPGRIGHHKVRTRMQLRTRLPPR